MLEGEVVEWIFLQGGPEVPSCTIFYDAVSRDVSETLFDMHNYKPETTEWTVETQQESSLMKSNLFIYPASWHVCTD